MNSVVKKLYRGRQSSATGAYRNY